MRRKMMDNPVTLTVQLSAEAVKRLEEMAQEQRRPLIEFVQDTLESVALDDEDYEDSDEQILSDLRESLQEAKRGEWLNFDDVLTELKQKYHTDDH
jgi:predicted transcriptional regulator